MHDIRARVASSELPPHQSSGNDTDGTASIPPDSGAALVEKFLERLTQGSTKLANGGTTDGLSDPKAEHSTDFDNTMALLVEHREDTTTKRTTADKIAHHLHDLR